MSHIKVQYVREACHVVGVLFFPVFLTQSFMHHLFISHCTACSSRQTSSGCRMGVRGHPQTRPRHHIQTRQSDGGCEYLLLQQTLLFASSLHIKLKQNQHEWCLLFFSLQCSAAPTPTIPLQSIMKNYDQNQDGYISLQDFEEIAANFPFSFCIRKTDRCGSRSFKKRPLNEASNSENVKRTVSNKPRLTNFCIMSWNISCPVRDKSVVKKSPLTSSGECRYVPSWATTSMMRTTFTKRHINGPHFVARAEVL